METRSGTGEMLRTEVPDDLVSDGDAGTRERKSNARGGLGFLGEPRGCWSVTKGTQGRTWAWGKFQCAALIWVWGR